MKFHVVGADKQTGSDVELDIDADSQREAENVATRQGLLVSLVEARKDAAPAAPVDDLLELAPPNTHTAAPPPQPKGIATAAPMMSTPAPAAGNAPAEEPAPAGPAPAPAADTHVEAHPEPAAAGPAPGGAVVDYHVLLNQSLYLLEAAVRKHISMGWEPQGGLTVGVSNNAMQYFQAVVRRNKA